MCKNRRLKFFLLHTKFNTSSRFILLQYLTHDLTHTDLNNFIEVPGKYCMYDKNLKFLFNHVSYVLYTGEYDSYKKQNLAIDRGSESGCQVRFCLLLFIIIKYFYDYYQHFNSINNIRHDTWNVFGSFAANKYIQTR